MYDTVVINKQHLPVQFGQRIVHAQLLVELGELLVRAEQVRRIRLALARHLKYESVVLLQVVALLEAVHGHRLEAAVLAHSAVQQHA